MLLTILLALQGVALDSAAVRTWADGLVIPAMEKSGVPGAIVVVVNRAGVLLNKGYGISDIATKTPVNPDRTLFNTASVGKSMTGLIVAQLLEEGLLTLDIDVNRYLTSTRIGGRDTVTLRMLLAHRGGFDDDITGLFVPFDGDIAIPRDELDRRLHPLVKPGYATAYDNQGFGVIGLILRDVMKQPISQLYRERLFDPAGMSGAAHGRPTDGKARLAGCYTVRGPGDVQPCEYWLYRDGLMGAGGVAMSGYDMARFMRLLLNNGTLDGRVVASPAAFANLINFDHARFHPGMPGGGLVFVQFEEFRGLEYAHSGHIPGFSTMMKVYPDADLAIFVTFLGGTPPSFDLTVTNVFRSLRRVDVERPARPGFAVLNSLTDSFAVKFIPAGRPRSSESANWKISDLSLGIDEFLGRYEIATNHSRSFVSRLAGWLGTITLERADSGVRLGGIPELGQYHEVGPLLYENATGERLALGKNADGRFMAVGLSGGVFRKTNALAAPGWTLLPFLASILILLTAFFQLRRRAAAALRALAKWELIGLLLVMVGLLSEWQWGILQAVGDGAILGPLLWRLMLHAGVVVLIWQAVRFVGLLGQVGRFGRLHGLILVAAGLMIVVSVTLWRLIGAFPPYWSW
ncbi:MAG TPA: serine hydrolase domain-containing protein [Gemmatimonadales bacterium]|nr:serine hydrolase domain-containing protein [Gemmatimonadales bacterium]